MLDQARQTLRLGNIEMAVESEASFGLLGAAARAGDAQSAEGANGEGDDRLKTFATNRKRSSPP